MRIEHFNQVHNQFVTITKYNAISTSDHWQSRTFLNWQTKENDREKERERAYTHGSRQVLLCEFNLAQIIARLFMKIFLIEKRSHKRALQRLFIAQLQCSVRTEWAIIMRLAFTKCYLLHWFYKCICWVNFGSTRANVFIWHVIFTKDYTIQNTYTMLISFPWNAYKYTHGTAVQFSSMQLNAMECSNRSEPLNWAKNANNANVNGNAHTLNSIRPLFRQYFIKYKRNDSAQSNPNE